MRSLVAKLASVKKKRILSRFYTPGWTQLDQNVLTSVERLLCVEEDFTGLIQPNGIGQRPRQMQMDFVSSPRNQLSNSKQFSSAAAAAGVVAAANAAAAVHQQQQQHHLQHLNGIPFGGNVSRQQSYLHAAVLGPPPPPQQPHKQQQQYHTLAVLNGHPVSLPPNFTVGPPVDRVVNGVGSATTAAAVAYDIGGGGDAPPAAFYTQGGGGRVGSGPAGNMLTRCNSVGDLATLQRHGNTHTLIATSNCAPSAVITTARPPLGSVSVVGNGVPTTNTANSKYVVTQHSPSTMASYVVSTKENLHHQHQHHHNLKFNAHSKSLGSHHHNHHHNNHHHGGNGGGSGSGSGSGNHAIGRHASFDVSAASSAAAVSHKESAVAFFVVKPRDSEVFDYSVVKGARAEEEIFLRRENALLRIEINLFDLN